MSDRPRAPLGDAALERLLESDALTDADRRRLRDDVVATVRFRKPASRRLSPLAILTAAAAGLLLGVFLTQAVQDDSPAVPPLENTAPTTTQAPEELVVPLRTAAVVDPASLEGTIVDPDGVPLEKAVVVGVTDLQGTMAEVDPTGHFHLRLPASPVPTTMFLVSAPAAPRRFRDLLYRHETTASPLMRLELEPGTPVTGRVFDGETGRPLAGAIVEMSVSWGGARIPLDAATTPSSGVFELQPPPAVRQPGPPPALRVVVTRNGYVTRVMHFALGEDLTEVFARPVSLKPGGRLVVRVTTGAGSPLAGAVVSLAPTRPGPDPFTYRANRGPLTDAVGRVEFEGIPPGPVHVKAFHPDTVPHGGLRVTVAGRATGEAALPLTRGQRIMGRVTDANRRSLAGAIVFAVADAASPNAGIVAHGPAVTGGEGRFLLPGLVPGKYSLHVFHTLPDGRESTARVLADVAAGRDDVAITLARSTLDLLFVVRNGHTGETVDDFAVTLLGPGGRAVRRPARTTDGRFVLRGVDPSRTAVQILAPGFLPTRLQHIRADGPTSRLGLSVSVYQPSEVSGTVVNSAGEPLPGAVVVGGRDEVESIRPDGRSVHTTGLQRVAVTDAAGRFHLAGLSVLGKESFAVTVLRPGHPPHSTPLAIAQGGVLEDVRLVVR